MTERKRLKNELRKLQYYKKSLPRLIDCSEAYGDFYYTEEDLKIVVSKKTTTIANNLILLECPDKHPCLTNQVKQQ